jgi:predicted acylesterase/phospholipase RssA
MRSDQNPNSFISPVILQVQTKKLLDLTMAASNLLSRDSFCKRTALSVTLLLLYISRIYTCHAFVPGASLRFHDPSGNGLCHQRRRQHQRTALDSSEASPLSHRKRRFSRFRNWRRRRTLHKARKLRNRLPSENDDETSESTAESASPVRQITTLEELDQYWDPDVDLKDPRAVLSALSVVGDTQMIGSPHQDDNGEYYVHPVLKVLHERKRRNRQGPQDDGENSSEPTQKIALVIEGGGMRGCVTAGMVAALHYLGLRDCFDVVYGSSAGSIIGAYFVAGQLPHFGPEVYYDKLPTAGKAFIDTGRLLRALGLGLLNPRLVKDVVVRRNSGKPVLNLDFLLKETLQNTKRLDWKTFQERQESGQQPLKIMASGMKSEKPIVMDYEHGHFTSLEELGQCMHASCLLPGITGPVMNLRVNADAAHKPKFVLRNNLQDDDYEPLADSLIYAPIPYHMAKQEGATHMVVLRSKPDGGDVIGKGGSIGERLIWTRFLLKKNKLPNIYRYLRQQRHKRLYSQNVLELNEASQPNNASRLPPTLTVALSEEHSEIARLESRREAIFEGVRSGFARAYDALVKDPCQRGKGHEVAKRFFPDEILDYSPSNITSPLLSAFETYVTSTGKIPKSWEGFSNPPLREPSLLDPAARESPSSSVLIKK